MTETTENYKHIRIRNPAMFSRFRVIKKMSHLDDTDKKLVRSRVSKAKRPACKFTVGKLKGGAKLEGRSWKLQKIMQPINRKGGKSKMGSKKKTYKKKATAKEHLKKGESVYKVKGGWRISHKKRRKRRKK